MYFRYSSSVVAPRSCSSPRARAGLLEKSKTGRDLSLPLPLTSFSNSKHQQRYVTFPHMMLDMSMAPSLLPRPKIWCISSTNKMYWKEGAAAFSRYMAEPIGRNPRPPRRGQNTVLPFPRHQSHP